jgi:signal transduction histidine kinase
MSQQCAPVQLNLAPLSSLESETANLKKQLQTQKKLVTALERRVGRSLESIQAHLHQLTQSFQDKSDWQNNLTSMAAELSQLGDLLADATLLQKMEAGKVAVHLEVLDLQLLLDCVSRHLLDPKSGATPRLIGKLPSTLPLVMGDRELTEAVLTDLLGRALKYSDLDAAIVLDVACFQSRVAIGITAQRFAPAGQRDFAPEIALCCKRVEVQGGEVTCQMQLDGFTSVKILLPIYEPLADRWQ